jgi:hypothetical protein
MISKNKTNVSWHDTAIGLIPFHAPFFKRVTDVFALSAYACDIV